MPSPKSQKLLLAILGVVRAWSGYVNGSISTGGALEVPPFGIPPAAIQAALSAPNATGTLTFQGYNLSDLSTSQSKTINWGLNVTISADVPLADASQPGEGVSASDTFTLSAIAINPPSPDVLPQGSGPGWTMCITVLAGLDDQGTRNGQDDAGTCSQAIRSECIAELLDSMDPAICFLNLHLQESSSCKEVLPPQLNVAAFG